MIFGAVPPRIYIASKPVDFRKGLDGLAALVKEVLKLDPFYGAAFIFRAKSADRIKILIWDGSGLILIYKRLDDAKFRWPRIEDGVMRLSPAQASALFEGLDWARVRAVRRRVPRPCNSADISLFLRAFSDKSWCCPAMIAVPDPLPDDIGALKVLVLHWTELAAAKDAALVEKDAELARVQDANTRLWETLRQLRRAQFGRK